MPLLMPQVENSLITHLPKRVGNHILAHCEQVNLTFGTVLCEQEQAFQNVYFPLLSIISLMVTVDGHEPLEMGLIGSEGMLGASLMLGVNTSTMSCVVQGTGSALKMTASQLRRELHNSPALVRALGRYVYALSAQRLQTAACRHFHAIEPRLARWLLMTHDRAHADHFHLTHEYLAGMLGVRRSGITVAAGSLQSRNLIHYGRGEIRVLDRKGLEAASCGCYSAMINA